MERLQKDTKKLREWRSMFITLTVVVMSQIYTYANTYAITYFNFEQFIVCQLHNKKLKENNNEIQVSPELTSFYHFTCICLLTAFKSEQF